MRNELTNAGAITRQQYDRSLLTLVDIGALESSIRQGGLPPHLQTRDPDAEKPGWDRFLGRGNEVPDTPGEQSAVGHVLTVSGTDDQSYRWRPSTPVDQDARDQASGADAQASTNADAIGTNTANIQQLGVQNNNLQRQITDLDRQTADLDIVSDGPGWAEASASDAGIALFAQGSTIGDGLLNDTRDLMQADVDGVSQWRQTIGLGATVQAVVVRIEGTLGPLDFALDQGGTIFADLYRYQGPE